MKCHVNVCKRLPLCTTLHQVCTVLENMSELGGKNPGYLLWVPLAPAILEALVSLEDLELQYGPTDTQTTLLKNFPFSQ